MGLESLSKGLLVYDEDIDRTEEEDINEMASADIGVSELLEVTVKHNLLSPTAGSLYTTLIEGFYIIPDFQRKFVWTQQQVAFLGLSIIKAIPIPTLYTYVDGRKEVLIDGQQRMMSLFLYFNDLYVEEGFDSKKLRYKEIAGLSTEYTELQKRLDELKEESKSRKLTTEEKEERTKHRDRCKRIKEELKERYSVKKVNYEIKIGKGSVDITFSHFSEEDQQYLKQRTMYLTKIDCNIENPTTLYMTIFALLNKAGKLLGPQEIRNGIYWESELYQKIAEFNATNDIWRKIYGAPSMVSKDMELLLKMLALEYYAEVEQGEIVKLPEKMKFTFNWANIMGHFSEKTKKADPQSYIHKLDVFFKRLEGLELEKKCNLSVLECFFVVTTKLWGDSPDIINYSWLCNVGTGEGKSVPFPKVESNKSSVNERLRITTGYVKQKKWENE